MAKNNSITIPEPCSQDWHKMTPAEKGRFCDSCQKEVFDFTKASDREIATAFSTHKNVCGRFNVSQLNRELIVPNENSSVWMIAATAVIGFLGFGNNNTYAQEKIKVEQTDARKQSDKDNTIDKGKDPIEVSGTIYDDSNLPLPGTSINIKGTLLGTTTNLEGNYTIKAEEGDVLVVSFIGFKTQEVLITSASKNTTVTLNLEMPERIQSFVGGAFYKKRTFFGRIFHSIGNIFR